MKYVEKVQVLLVDEENPENTTIKTYDGKECCAVFWGPKGREFYIDAIQNNIGLTISEQEKRLAKLKEIESIAYDNQEEFVCGKTTECVLR